MKNKKKVVSFVACLIFPYTPVLSSPNLPPPTRPETKKLLLLPTDPASKLLSGMASQARHLLLVE